MTPHSLSSLAGESNTLAPHYAAFRVAERLLLTGHSHQAWPDCAADGLLACFRDAAAHVDDKWQLSFERAERVRAGVRCVLGEPSAVLSLGASTHELVVRFLSALPLKTRPRVVTSDAEFHSLRRQLDRLAEEGVEVVRVPSSPVHALSERLAHAVERDPDRTAAVLVSSVLFTTAELVPGLPELAACCARHGCALLVDAYHHVGVVPFSMTGLEGAFVVGGGYKYLQLGEGNCFLRVPEGCTLRPVVTGWFAEFGSLGTAPGKTVGYAEGPLRFSGSTYDPASHYRAAAVFDFFEREGLSPALLRAVSQHQVGELLAGFEALDVDPRKAARATATTLDGLGGFLALRVPRAAELERGLTARGVRIDRRGDIVRFGPAPYLCDRQLRDAMGALREALGELG